MIGLSLSFCIADVCRGIVPLKDVERIDTSTAAPDMETWEELISQYKKIYWRDFPEEAERITRQLLAEGKIYQPRLDGHPIHSIVDGHWLP